MTASVAKLPESIYRTVLNSMEHGYVFMGPDARITLFNDAACRILGVSADQLKGKATTDRDWGTIREDGSEFPSDRHPIMVSLKTQKPCYGVVMGIRVGGERIRWLVINSDVVRDSALSVSPARSRRFRTSLRRSIRRNIWSSRSRICNRKRGRRTRTPAT